MAFRFYSHHPDRNGWQFSNFSKHPVEWEGKIYPTSEHLYQSLKFEFVDPEYAKAIRKAKTPMTAKKMGRGKHQPNLDEWEKIKVKVMFEIITEKVKQHEDVRQILLETGKKKMIEASPTDYYWGEGEDGTGKNMLGKVLMKVRENLQASNK